MPATVSVQIQSIAELLSGGNTFVTPWFQRAYAWQQQHVQRLVSDIREDMKRAARGRRYFLGTMMLSPKDGQNALSIIDGHQRLLTLTIIFAVLRDLERDGAQRARLEAMIRVPPPRFRRSAGPPSWRVVTQSSLSQFIARHIQEPGATLVVPEDDLLALSETERNIIVNRDYLAAELGGAKVSDKERRALAAFLADSCHVFVRRCGNEDEGWRILQIEEETRLDFHPADRAKSSLLSLMPADHRDEAAEIWDQCVEELGRGDLYSLLGYLRTIAMRRRRDTPIEADLGRHFGLDSDGLTFMRATLVPMTSRLAALRSGGDLPGARSIAFLNWTERDVWVPAALHWLSKHKGGAAETTQFLWHLERHQWLNRIAGTDPTQLETRTCELINEIDKRRPVEDMSALAIEAKTLNEALANLRSTSFAAKHFAAALLKRLGCIETADADPFDQRKLTIEHILPRNPGERSQWRQTFQGKPSIKANANRLGNLVLATPKENGALGTKEWADKQKLLAPSTSPLAARAAREREWTKQTVERRTEALIKMLFTEWKLPM